MKLSAKVERVLAGEQITAEELQHMLKHAAITRIRGFNWRYFHWLFRLQGETLQDMQHAQLVEIGKGKGDTLLMEDHLSCRGEGCRECGWVGQIGRWVEEAETPAYAPLTLHDRRLRTEYDKLRN